MDDQELLGQLYDAMLAARQHNKTQFVFREHSGDHWWHSGFLPVEATDFFVLYPSGEFDKSSDAPTLDPKAWSDYVMGREHDLGSIEVDGDVKAPVVGEAVVAKRSPWGGFNKVLLGFCAFAPFAMLGAGLRFAEFSPSVGDGWAFAWPSIACCIPFTLYMLFFALNHKNPRLGWTSSTLLCNAHMVVYGLTCFMAKLSEFPGTIDVNHHLVTVVIMLSLMATGVALLLLWDSKEAR